jgi:hypothetical protein
MACTPCPCLELTGCGPGSLEEVSSVCPKSCPVPNPTCMSLCLACVQMSSHPPGRTVEPEGANCLLYRCSLANRLCSTCKAQVAGAGEPALPPPRSLSKALCTTRRENWLEQSLAWGEPHAGVCEQCHCRSVPGLQLLFFLTFSFTASLGVRLRCVERARRCLWRTQAGVKRECHPSSAFLL